MKLSDFHDRNIMVSIKVALRSAAFSQLIIDY